MTTSAIGAPANPSSALPIGHPGDWVSDDDYPTAALRDNAEGVVGFVLAVGADGVPTRCEVGQSSGNADLDAATCNLLMQRARFSAATDAKGNPVTSTYANKVRWTLPNDGKFSVSFPGEIKLQYDVAADGTVSNCNLTVTGEVATYLPKGEEADRCANVGPFSRQTDKAGKPVNRHVVETQTVTVTNFR